MMTVQGMLGVFILLGISIVVGFVIMIVERIYASAKEKHEKVRQIRVEDIYLNYVEEDLFMSL